MPDRAARSAGPPRSRIQNQKLNVITLVTHRDAPLPSSAFASTEWMFVSMMSMINTATPPSVAIVITPMRAMVARRDPRPRASIRPGSRIISTTSNASSSAGKSQRGAIRPASGTISCRNTATRTAAAIGQRRSAVGAACLPDPSSMTAPSIGRQDSDGPGETFYALAMETWDALRSRRNTRDYENRPIESADLDLILEAGRRSPSSRNTQPWDFIVVTDRGTLERMADLWRWGAHIRGAAAAIALLSPASDDPEASETFAFDLGQASMSMMLAAADL